MKLYIIRHAQSINNALTDMRDRLPDPPLTKLGQQQIKFVARHLANGMGSEGLKVTSGQTKNSNKGCEYGISRLYCSPMVRALQTARPIGQALGLAPEIWLDIHERGGVFGQPGQKNGSPAATGLTRSQILAKFPHYQLPDDITEAGWWSGGCETWPTCHGRAIKVAQELRQWVAKDERIAIISHGGFINALLKALCNTLPGRHLTYHHHNTAITRLDFLNDGRLRLRYLNRIDHLPPELIS